LAWLNEYVAWLKEEREEDVEQKGDVEQKEGGNGRRGVQTSTGRMTTR